VSDAKQEVPPTDVLRHVRAQRRRAAVPVTQPLMLCSQIQRSGGTLLSRLFDGHPSCFAHPNELRWGRPKGWPSVPLHGAADAVALFHELQESWPVRFARRGYVKDRQHVEASGAEHAPLPFLFDPDLQFTIFQDALPATVERQRDVLNAYLTSLFNAWLDYQHLYNAPKRWVTAFEPRFLARRDGGPDAFFADYPDGLLVTIVREPVSWVASYQRHVPERSLEKALRLWTDSLQAGVQACETHGNRVVLIMFDDLVHRTEAVMRRLCARMDIAFERSLLEPTFNSMPVLSNSSHAPAFGIDPVATTRGRLVPERTGHDPLLEDATVRYETVRARFAV